MGKVIVSHLGGHNTDRKIGSFQQRPGHIHFFQKNIILKGFPRLLLKQSGKIFFIQMHQFGHIGT